MNNPDNLASEAAGILAEAFNAIAKGAREATEATRAFFDALGDAD